MSKNGYFGVNTEIPVYEEQTVTTETPLSISNLSSFFSVTTGSTASTMWDTSDVTGTSGKIKLVPGNIGVNSSTATITLQALDELTGVVVSGAYYTESNFDKISLTVAGTYPLASVSGTSALADRWTGTLAKGQTIILSYTKDSSQHATGEANTAFYIACNPMTKTETKRVQVGSIYKDAARVITKGYFGVTQQMSEYETTTTRTTLTADNVDDYLSNNIGTSDPWRVFQNSANNTISYSADNNSSNFKANTEYTLFLMFDKAIKGVKLSLIAQFTTRSSNNLLSLTFAGTSLYNKQGTEVPVVSSEGAIYQVYTPGDVAAQSSLLLKYKTAATATVGNNPNAVQLNLEGYEETVNKTYIGTVEKEIAHKIIKAYIGDENNKARVWFDQSTSASFTGTSTVQDVTVDGKAYKLHTLTSSGTLTVTGSGIKFWICGGGATGENSYIQSSLSKVGAGRGGGGGYVAEGTLSAGTWNVLIGAGGVKTSGTSSPGGGNNGGTTSITNGSVTYTAEGGKCTGNGGSGGGTAYSCQGSSSTFTVVGTGQGAGVSTIPFGITSLDKHCAGGAGGICFLDSASVYRDGGRGGSNGGNGVNDGSRNPGEKGGGGSDAAGSTAGYDATYYGSAGGGAPALQKDSILNSIVGTGGNGYQGVMYLLVPC